MNLPYTNVTMVPYIDRIWSCVYAGSRVETLREIFCY